MHIWPRHHYCCLDLRLFIFVLIFDTSQNMGLSQGQAVVLMEFLLLLQCLPLSTIWKTWLGPRVTKSLSCACRMETQHQLCRSGKRASPSRTSWVKMWIFLCYYFYCAMIGSVGQWFVLYLLNVMIIFCVCLFHFHMIISEFDCWSHLILACFDIKYLALWFR